MSTMNSANQHEDEKVWLRLLGLADSDLRDVGDKHILMAYGRYVQLLQEQMDARIREYIEREHDDFESASIRARNDRDKLLRALEAARAGVDDPQQQQQVNNSSNNNNDSTTPQQQQQQSTINNTSTTHNSSQNTGATAASEQVVHTGSSVLLDKQPSSGMLSDRRNVQQLEPISVVQMKPQDNTGVSGDAIIVKTDISEDQPPDPDSALPPSPPLLFAGETNENGNTGQTTQLADHTNNKGGGSLLLDNDDDGDLELTEDTMFSFDGGNTRMQGDARQQHVPDDAETDDSGTFDDLGTLSSSGAASRLQRRRHTDGAGCLVSKLGTSLPVTIQKRYWPPPEALDSLPASSSEDENGEMKHVILPHRAPPRDQHEKMLELSRTIQAADDPERLFGERPRRRRYRTGDQVVRLRSHEMQQQRRSNDIDLFLEPDEPDDALVVGETAPTVVVAAAPSVTAGGWPTKSPTHAF